MRAPQRGREWGHAAGRGGVGTRTAALGLISLLPALGSPGTASPPSPGCHRSGLGAQPWHHAAPAAAGSSPRGSRALSRNPNLSSEQTTLSTCLQLSQPLCQVGEEGMQFGARHCCTSLRNVGSETGDAWDCKEQLQPVLLRLIPTSEPTLSS